MTSRHLRIADALTLPLDTVTATMIVYGGKGMGKTNLLSVVLEEMSKAGLRWCSIDPMGVHWGLRHAADGRGDGVPCLILGGIHGDMPITPASGEIVADLVADEHVNVIIDCSRNASGSMWTATDRTRFITTYVKRLFQRQGSLIDGQRREPIFVALDEAARYVPQTIPHGNPDLAASVSAWEQMVEEGRNVGIGCGLFTQRSARLNKSVAELADAMAAFRTTGPNSIDAIIDWLGEHVPKADQRAMVEQVRQLPVGTCLLVSPGWLNFEGLVTIRARETFDSSATPKPGERARRVIGAGAAVDLDAYRKRMTEVVEQAQATDPRALRTKVTTLTSERDRLTEELTYERDRTAFLHAEAERLAAAASGAPATRDAARQAVDVLKGVVSGAERAAQVLARVLDDGDQPLAVPSPPRTRPEPAPRRVAPAEPGDTTLSGAARKILTALAQHGARTPGRVAHLTGYSPSGAFSRTMTALRASGYVEGTGLVDITEPGRTALGPYDPLPEGRALVEHWLSRLNSAEAKILTALVEEWPDAATPGGVAARTGYSPNGAFSRAMTHLRKLDLVVAGPGRGQVKAHDVLGAAWSGAHVPA